MVAIISASHTSSSHLHPSADDAEDLKKIMKMLWELDKNIQIYTNPVQLGKTVDVYRPGVGCRALQICVAVGGLVGNPGPGIVIGGKHAF